jgi:hypothetical protein
MHVRLIKALPLGLEKKRATGVETSTVTLGTFAVKLESVNLTDQCGKEQCAFCKPSLISKRQ